MKTIKIEEKDMNMFDMSSTAGAKTWFYGDVVVNVKNIKGLVKKYFVGQERIHSQEGFFESHINNDATLIKEDYECGIYLIDFGNSVVTKDVIKFCENNNLRPTTVSELVALSAKYPELQERKSIISFNQLDIDLWSTASILGHEKGENIIYFRGNEIYKRWWTYDNVCYAFVRK